MKQRILVSLDSILDTRLGTLIDIDPKEATKIVKSNYRKRLSDIWSELGSGIDQDTYVAKYKERGLDVLKKSKPTNIIPILNQITNELGEARLGAPFIEDIVVEVNTWPYVFSEEVENVILDTIRHLVSIDCIVKSTHLAPIHLMPNIISDTWDAVVMYDFDQWLNIHSEALKIHKLPTVRFIVPSIFAKGSPNKEDLKANQYGMSPFEELEHVLSEFLSLNMISIDNFSITNVKT